MSKKRKYLDIEKTCDICHNVFNAHHDDIYRCDACEKIIRGLHTSMYHDYTVKLDKSMFYPLYEILITYQVNDTRGYYSNESIGDKYHIPSSIRIIRNFESPTETIRYPLLKLFKTSDMNKNDFSIKSDNHILTSYYMPNIYGDSETYCHGSYYKVKSAQVVKKETIELDG